MHTVQFLLQKIHTTTLNSLCARKAHVPTAAETNRANVCEMRMKECVRDCVGVRESVKGCESTSVCTHAVSHWCSVGVHQSTGVKHWSLGSQDSQLAVTLSAASKPPCFHAA